MSAAMSTGYVKSPTVVASVPCLADLSLNCVMRLASPKPVSVPSTHASSAWAGTWDCTKRVERSRSTPDARYWAAVRRTFACRAAGSCCTVIACRSTTQ
jgi:hypothetical protein